MENIVYYHIEYVKNPVGLPGIEPGLYAPEAYVLPVYYSPTGLSTPKSRIYFQHM